MIRLSKSALHELVEIMFLANTPKSLFKAIIKSRAFDCLKDQCSEFELSNYYDVVTARAHRTPAVAGLAYAVLIALLGKSSTPQAIDANRLEWGEQIAPLAAMRTNVPQVIVLPGNIQPRPKMILTSFDGAKGSFFSSSQPATKNLIIT